MTTIPKEVKTLIDHYFNLKINNKTVKTPYHINVRHVRAELRSLVGKGSPEEIEEEVNIFAKLRNFNLQKASKEEIREFMQKEGLGIDCSGLISHILATWLKAEKKGSLSSNITFPKLPLVKRVAVLIRPIENINANLLTNKENTIPIDLKNVQAGDLIRLKGIKKGDHIAIIVEVRQNEKGQTEIVYIHSTKYYGANNGIKEGTILVVNEHQDLDKQEWLEKDEKGICWTEKQYFKEKEDNGFRRPKFFLETK